MAPTFNAAWLKLDLPDAAIGSSFFILDLPFNAWTQGVRSNRAMITAADRARVDSMRYGSRSCEQG
jgi:hypothetical protein